MRKKINFKAIEDFGRVNLPAEDMAVLLNMPVKAIHRLMQPGRKFYQHYRRGQALTKFDIIRTQLNVAMGQAKGNSSMLSYLGTVLLGQQPRVESTADENTEAMLQNIPSGMKSELFATLMGFDPSPSEVLDDET